MAAQNLAVAQSDADVVAFSDANATWAPDALRKLVRAFADPEVAYCCGRLVLEAADGTNVEGVYWRMETWLREQESETGSLTGGYGSIYAVRRSDYADVDPALRPRPLVPYLMVQRGRRAVYDGEALAFEKPTPDVEDEYRRKVRMFEHGWLMLHKGRMLERLPPGYLVKLVSHRHLRFGSGMLHLGLLGSSFLLARRGDLQLAWLGQLAFLAEAARQPGMARYYTLVTWGTVESLKNYPTTACRRSGTRLRGRGCEKLTRLRRRSYPDAMAATAFARRRSGSTSSGTCPMPRSRRRRGASTVRGWFAGRSSPTGKRAEKVAELAEIVDRLTRIIHPSTSPSGCRSRSRRSTTASRCT